MREVSNWREIKEESSSAQQSQEKRAFRNPWKTGCFCLLIVHSRYRSTVLLYRFRSRAVNLAISVCVWSESWGMDCLFG